MGNEIEKKADQPEQAVDRDVVMIAEGAGINLAGKFFGRAMHWVSQLILARWLGPAMFGLYAISWNLLRTLGIVVPLGLDFGVIRFGVKHPEEHPEEQSNVIGLSLGISFLVGLGAGLLLRALAPTIAQIFDKPGLVPVLRLMALALPLMSGLRVAAAATRLTKNMKFSILSEEVGQPLANLLGIAIVYYAGWSLMGVVGVVVVSFGIGLLFSIGYVRQLFFRNGGKFQFPVKTIKPLLAFSFQTAFASMFLAMIVLNDRIAVGYFLPEADVGIYQTVSISAVAFVMVLSSFNTIVQPMITEHYRDKDIDRLENVYQVSTRWGMYIGIPILVALIVASQDFISVFFGFDYLDGQYPLIVLCLGNMIYLGVGAVEHLLVMTGHQKDWFQIVWVMLAANVLLNIILTPAYGLIGASTATLMTFTGLAGLSLWRIKKILNICPYKKKNWKLILSAAVSLGSAFWVSAHFSLPALRLAGVSLSALLSFVMMILLLKMDKDDYDMVSLLVRGWKGVK